MFVICYSCICRSSYSHACMCVWPSVNRILRSIWSQSEQFEAASQSELLIGVVLMSVLQLPGPQPKHTGWDQLRSHLLLRPPTAERNPTHVSFGFASCVWLFFDMLSLILYRTQNGTNQQCPCYTIKLLYWHLKLLFTHISPCLG